MSTIARLILSIIGLSVLVVSCTTKRDGVAYRIYHNTTTHYNGHFNADQAMLKAEAKILSNTTEDFDSILSVIALGNDDAVKTAYEDFERVIEKSEKVIAKHTKQRKQLKLL
jgi:N-acyl-D-aspartate/D-glutamate deacylase